MQHRSPVRRLRPVLVAVAAALIGFTAVPTTHADAALSSGQLTVTKVVSGLSSPLGVVNAGDGSGRLFIVQQGGRVRVVKGMTLQSGSFLDMSSKLSTGGERGLLGLAFHPDFATNRRLFVFYTRSGGDIVVSRMTANSARTSAPVSSEVVLFTIEHSSQGNHNGGSMAFGPDGYLYIGVGDGGGSGDPNGNGQSIETRLGKVLRIDVDGTGEGVNDAFSYPPSNPYVGVAGDDAIFARGLRNPWRLSFDRATGDLWIGDVGQARYEEIDRDAYPPSPGRNYGWKVMEGKHCYNASSCNQSGLTLPVAEYTHASGCSVTGGYVYRGATQRDLQGLYVFGDFCSGRIWTLNGSGSGLTQRRDTSLLITSFGESETGELFVVSRDGRLYRVIAPEFTDIASSRFLDDIHWIFYEGITKGCSATRYCPTSRVTRGQMATFLDRALHLPATSKDFFTDDETSKFEGSINRLAASGITKGCSATRYCPNGSVTRGQMAAFLDRALHLPATSKDFFTDDETSRFEGSINRLAASGITHGCSATRFCPNDVVTRQQMAAFLHRAFDD
jgi:glucose/arabinose dehydrogenase